MDGYIERMSDMKYSKKKVMVKQYTLKGAHK